MLHEDIIRRNLDNTLSYTDLPKLGKKIKGKVRDSYVKGDRRIIITTDRISAFDRVLTTLPFKGQILSQLSSFWFEKTKDIIDNAVTANPDPNVIIFRECKVFPIEVVVRGYLAGSAWRDYESGRSISGITLPPGLKKNQRLPKPIVTPSTKAESGHDIPMSREDIINKNILPKDAYEEIERAALELFSRGTSICAEQGLILVDTKYEFADDDGKVVLVDEIHTPDSSRFWYSDTYEKLFLEGKEQRMLDKEYVRIWLMEQGFMGDGAPPEIPDDVKVEAVRKYSKAYEQITGEVLDVSDDPIKERIEKSLEKYM